METAMKRTFGIRILLSLVFLIALVLSAESGVKTLKAKKITAGKAPKIDGKIDKIWKKAKRLKISVKGDGEYDINTKVLYTKKHVFFLFEWKDKTESLNRFYTFKKGKWKKMKGNEDRFNLAWDINGNIKDFKTKSCQVLCHKGEDESVMKTGGPKEKADLWHWKAQRTNPVGYADEQFIQHISDAQGHETTGRRSDQKNKGGYSNNWDKAKNRPIYMSTGKSGPVLLKTKAKKVDGNTVFKEGTIAPREVLERAEGSRGDIMAKAIWKKGKWILELQRALNTGHDDDIQFTDLKKDYFFGIAVHENGDGEKHATTKEAVKLQFK
jgi:hypothetical protein